MTSRYIFKVVQEEFSDYDMKHECRKHEFVYPRFVYFELCREFTEESLFSVGDNVDRDHASVLHGHARFKELTKPEVDAKFLPYFKIYTQLRQKLIAIRIKYNKVRMPKNDYEKKLEQEIKLKYEKLLIEMTEFHIAEIDKYKKMESKLKKIEKLESIEDIIELPENDIEEFDRLAKIFYKRKMYEERLKS